MIVWQEEVNSGRAYVISIMYFALFILEQLKEEVDTMMSEGPEQRWVGELLAHINTSVNTLRLTHTLTTVWLHSQRLQVHESRKTGVPYLLNSVVMKMSIKAKAVLHTQLWQIWNNPSHSLWVVYQSCFAAFVRGSTINLWIIECDLWIRCLYCMCVYAEGYPCLIGSRYFLPVYPDMFMLTLQQ